MIKPNYKKAEQALKAMGVPTYQRSDMPNFGISAEDSDSYKWLDYYEGYRMDWDFGVHPEIGKTLAKFGLRCEWENPGELGVYAD
jgi:hypothetical protein